MDDVITITGKSRRSYLLPGSIDGQMPLACCGDGVPAEEERIEYFQKRDIICIVPVNSTLKTHEKLISLFCEHNRGVSVDNIILNYALILVGSKNKNNYWEIDEENRTFKSVELEIKPIPHYFLAVKVKYYEAFECELCFPENPLDEVPLVEVNASSTIPNQAFGLLEECREKRAVKYKEDIESEEKKIAILKDSLIYSHTKRGENHYLFYFKTDELFLRCKDSINGSKEGSIRCWLDDVKNKVKAQNDEYHILFCPAHFSNAGFLEYITQTSHINFSYAP